MQRVHCVAMALKTSMDSHKDATACYELKMPVKSHFSSLLAGIFLEVTFQTVRGGSVMIAVVLSFLEVKA